MSLIIIKFLEWLLSEWNVTKIVEFKSRSNKNKMVIYYIYEN
jgi:hypothetical protein